MKVSHNRRMYLHHISKSFPGVKALQKVDFELLEGEVHVLCGENGAGKSTLMHILAGNLRPDQGAVYLDGKEIRLEGPEDAGQKGIAIVYQERSLTDALSVAENIFANRQPRNRMGLIDFKKMNKHTSELLQRLQLDDIPPGRKVGHLSAGKKQMIEIAKALSGNPSVLILDEPTASITEKETQLLFGIIRDLRMQGVSIIYISHRMKEVFDIGDRISVLKDGKYQGTFPIAEITQDVLFNKMIGRDIQVHEMASPAQKNIVLEARNLSGAGFHHINFSLHQGEILALTGLVGAGRTEIARAIFGVNPIHQGQLFIHGVSARIRHPRDAILRGIGYLPEERKEDGLFLPMSMAENILAGKIAIQRGMLRSHSNQDAVEGYIRLLNISPGNAEQKAINFSGGNQQKMVLAKWLLLEPGIFIADEPTHGIDVGAKHEIYQLLNKLAAKGAGILLISSELPEALTLAHRILVICRGHLTADLARDKAIEEDIMHYASGTKNMFSGV